MYKAALSDIRDKILTANTYFAQGFSDVYSDNTKGIVNAEAIVFPSDTLGNYFYLRLPKSITFNNGLGDLTPTMSIILVAIVRDADADKLLTNLLQTLLNQCQSVGITAANVIREDVLRTELQGILDAKGIEAALARLNNFTLVSVSFTYATEIMKKPLTCIVNPCKAC